MTGDFFPQRRLDETLGNYGSDSAVETVRQFFADRLDCDEPLRMNILRSADMLFHGYKIAAKS